MPKLIDQLILPGDLKKLKPIELKIVTEELRSELIENVAFCGGHLASSLGAAELAVALHTAFDTPHDRLIWDVGHQAYIHKMLTGRRNRMPTLRKKGGISGFLRREESIYDTFISGHAGTSISAAVGMACALKEMNPKRFVVAVIGDGAMTCGMAFEAMNQAGELGLGNLIVVLNDNEMSISPNVGAISWFFSRSITSQAPTLARSKFKSLYRRGYIPDVIYKAIDRVEDLTQGAISGASMLFEAFGFRYIGPVDGHNLEDLLKAFRNAKNQDVPVLVHARTIKGKGYEPAENDPVQWHGVQPFQSEKRESQVCGVHLDPPLRRAKQPLSYTSVFARTLCRVARRNPKIVAITAAMPTGTGLDRFQKEFPNRFFDVGICEDHAVTFAAGLACEGFRPVCAIYSSFLQRGYDQILHDVCLQNLPVVFALDRSGVVGEDGETHQGVFDVAYLRSLPNMTIMAPRDEVDLQHMIWTALNYDGPVAIRYPKGLCATHGLIKRLCAYRIGCGEIVTHGSDLLFICLGPMVDYALAAAQALNQDFGVTSTVVNARFAKPLDQDLLLEELPRHRFACTIEDHVLAGGFGSAVLELANDLAVPMQYPIYRFGVGDAYVPHATQAEQHQAQKYDPQSIYIFIAERLRLSKAVGMPAGK